MNRRDFILSSATAVAVAPLVKVNPAQADVEIIQRVDLAGRPWQIHIRRGSSEWCGLYDECPNARTVEKARKMAERSLAIMRQFGDVKIATRGLAWPA